LFKKRSSLNHSRPLFHGPDGFLGIHLEIRPCQNTFFRSEDLGMLI
jgi:hypothetical protein